MIHARVVDALTKLRLGHGAERLDALLSDAAKAEPTYLDFLDRVLGEELSSKQRKRVAMGIQIAHLPTVKDDLLRWDLLLRRRLLPGRAGVLRERVLPGRPDVLRRRLPLQLPTMLWELVLQLGYELLRPRKRAPMRLRLSLTGAEAGFRLAIGAALYRRVNRTSRAG